MKRLFLLIFCVAAMAGKSFGYNFERYDGQPYYTMSPNGLFMIANNDGVINILNVVTGEESSYTPDMMTGARPYNIGGGNAVNNLGMVVGTMTEQDPAVWQNGEWTALPLKGTEGSWSIANGITPDGKYVCGSISTTSSLGGSGTNMHPCLWTKGEDGNYGVYELLPCPATDFTGRAPQYITAMSISDDGNVIAGQIVSFDGFANYPIIYTKGSDGKWSYTVVGLDKIVKAGVTFPKYPTYEPQAPNFEDYMSAEDKAKYQAALTKYNEDFEKWLNDPTLPEPTYPNQMDYLTDKDGYNAAQEKYNKEYKAYSDSVDAFSKVYNEATTGASYVFNTIYLSANGKYLGQTIQRPDPNGDPLNPMGSKLSTPAIIDLTNEGKVSEGNSETMMVQGVTNDGTMMAASPAVEYTRNAYVIAAGTTEPVKFDKWIAGKCKPAQGWLKENMIFDVVTSSTDANGNETTETHLDSLVTGSVTCNPEGTVFVGYMYNGWSQASGSTGYVSYKLDITDPDKETGITATRKDDAENVVIKAEDGVITAAGSAAALDVYDVAGRKVAAAKAGRSVSVNSGLYVVKATAADGSTVTKKVSVKK